MSGGTEILVSPAAADRVAAARTWLLRHPPSSEVLVVGHTLESARELIAAAVATSGAAFGWRRATLGSLASQIALSRLLALGLTSAGELSRDAVVARAVERLSRSGGLGRLAPVADAPGLVRALGRALEEARFGGFGADALAQVDPELGPIAAAVEESWEEVRLADRARTFAEARDAALEPDVSDPLLDLPTLFLDVPLHTDLERALAAGLLARAPEALVTVPAGDDRTLAALGAPAESSASERGPRALDQLQAGLFGSDPVEPAAGDASDDSLTIFSAPGEGRECVEIVRRLLRLSEEGVPFDRAAVLLRQPEDYRPYLEEAFTRARIGAYFARGVRRPDPAGRAFLALLRCRAEEFSAVRFAEYLSIGQVPDAVEEGEPPPAPPDGARWVPPDDEPSAVAAGPQLELTALLESAPAAYAPPDAAPPDAASPDAPPVRAGSLRVPRRWERALVEAAVVGGHDRWRRRLAGLEASLRLQLEGLEEGREDDPKAAAIERQLEDLGHLRAYALPLLDELAGLPEAADWSAWLAGLRDLAARSLRYPDSVLGVLAELAPMGPIGPGGLGEVLRVLAPRLLEVTQPPAGTRFGRVFVGPVEAARGLAFDVVFVPGLAERVFPPKIGEDPILLDAVRERLNAAGSRDAGGGPGPGAPGLPTNEDRVAAERLALRLAIGAARERVVLSFARIEATKSRPRVPSFYALEAIRAAEGRLPRFEDLASRAERVSDARIGWPAPKSTAAAVDEAEYDLAVLDALGARGEEAVKAAGHLLGTNPHLARSLRARAYRWEVRKWTGADGFLRPSPAGRAALAEHGLDERSFSATALQHFAACPYRFFLYTVQRLEPREVPAAIEELDPLERGSLIHEVQFELLSELRDEGLLPVRPDTLPAARDRLDGVLDRVAEAYRDRLFPAIPRVWQDGIDSIRADLREWLYREARSDSPFEPWRFELAFGLPPDPKRDPHSRADPALLDTGLRLRGAIDLVERAAGDAIRVTDHKTGRAWAKPGDVIKGGEVLQPVLYALATEKLVDEGRVHSGRLYYCTAHGGFDAHEVPLTDEARAAARTLTDVLRWALQEPCLPAAPRKGACRWCDYLPVCGPDEERRIRRKPELTPLETLRKMP